MRQLQLLVIVATLLAVVSCADSLPVTVEVHACVCLLFILAIARGQGVTVLFLSTIRPILLILISSGRKCWRNITSIENVTMSVQFH